MVQKPSADKKQKLPEISKAVAVAVSDVVRAAEGLKGEIDKHQNDSKKMELDFGKTT